MKKLVFFALTFCFFTNFIFCQRKSSSQDPLVQFVKGNISDKTAAVKRAPEDSPLAKKALDYVIENSEILKGDRDLAALAVAGILSYPASEYVADPKEVVVRFSHIFYAIDDANVKISVFDKIENFYKKQGFDGAIAFVNEYLVQKIDANAAIDDTVKKAIDVLGNIGNGSSFAPLYSILQQGIWQEIHPNIRKSLATMADKSLNEIVDTVIQAELVELKNLFQIYEKNDKISSSLRSEIADKMLNRSMIIAGNISLSNDLAEFQLEAAKVLSDNLWTRSAELGKNYFYSAKTAYEGNYLNETQFAEAIGCVEKLSSRSVVKPFSDYMEQINKAKENGNPPSKAVALAIINALGSLGDKSAFDCLLYVTYLDYSEDITAAARNALTRLKW